MSRSRRGCCCGAGPGWRSLEKRRTATGQGTTESPGNRASTPVSAIIKASRKAVYTACLDPDALAAWRVPDSMKGEVHVFEAQEGGMYRMSLTY